MEFGLAQALLLAGVGVVAGFMNVMAGGGSLLTVPVMVFMGLPGPVANGTNRIAILAQNLSAIGTFRHLGLADFRLSLSLSACAIPGAIAGALVGVQLEGEWFNRALALIMVAVLLVMQFQGKAGASPGGSHRPDRRQLLRGHLLMVGVGFWGGFIQIGVGFLIMPVLHRIMGFDLVHTNMHKVFIVAAYTVAALIVFASQVQILWLVGAALAAGNALGGFLGARTSVRRGERLIRWVLNIVLVAFIVKLLFFP